MTTDLLATARALQTAGDTADALIAWKSLLRQTPDNIEALHMTGVCCQQSGLTQDALDYLHKARLGDSHDPYIAYNLALSLNLDKQHAAALPLAIEAAQNLPHQAPVLLTLGNIQMALNNTASAIAAYDAALRQQAEYPEARYNRGLCHLLDGNWDAGWPDWEYRWKSAFFTSPKRHFSCPQWHGDSLDGKHLHLHAEQGLGDMIQMLRYIPAIRALAPRHISIEAKPPLLRLVQDSLPGITITSFGEALKEQPDFHLPMMSLPGLFHTRCDTVPQPWTPGTPGGRPIIAQKKPGKPVKIGLVYAGNPNHPRDAERSMSPAMLTGLRDIPGLSLFSFQLGDAARDMRRRAWRDHVTDLSGELVDFTDTCTCLYDMDLVISVDSVVAHLAASMGIETWILLSFAPDWRWMLDREDSPWYPAVTLFRQSVAGDWSHPVSDILDRLKAGSE